MRTQTSATTNASSGDSFSFSFSQLTKLTNTIEIIELLLLVND